MTKKKQTIELSCVLLILLMFLGIGASSNIKASDDDAQLILDPILPSNQIDKQVKYFDLLMEPGSKQKLTINVTNNSSDKVKYKIAYSDAKTTSNGIIEYSENRELKSNIPRDLMFTNIVKGPSEIELEGKEVKGFTFSLDVPRDEFNGFIAGGIEFIPMIEHKENVLRTTQSYSVGMRLRVNENNPPTEIEMVSIETGLKNFKNAILVSLKNQNGKYIEDLTVKTILRKKNESTVLLETKSTNMRMAPYSILEFPIYLDDYLIGSGVYEMTVEATSEGQSTFKWIENFNVSKKKANLFSENKNLWEGTTKKKQILLLFILFIFVILSFIIKVNKRCVPKKNKKRGEKMKKKQKVNYMLLGIGIGLILSWLLYSIQFHKIYFDSVDFATDGAQQIVQILEILNYRGDQLSIYFLIFFTQISLSLLYVIYIWLYFKKNKKSSYLIWMFLLFLIIAILLNSINKLGLLLAALVIVAILVVGALTITVNHLYGKIDDYEHEESSDE